jgi:hypothetical protein
MNIGKGKSIALNTLIEDLRKDLKSPKNSEQSKTINKNFACLERRRKRRNKMK